MILLLIMILGFICYTPCQGFEKKSGASDRISGETGNSNKIVVNNARGVVLLGNGADAKKYGWDAVEGVTLVSLSLPGSIDELQEKLMPMIEGKDLTVGDIQKIKSTIVQFYHEHDHPFVRIQVPKQHVANGVFQLVVQEATIGTISVKGNKYFKTSRIEKLFNARPGEAIDEEEVLSDLNFINRNPFRKADIVYAAGKYPGTTDVVIAVQDRFPFRVYSGYDNTGIEPLGKERLFVGANWANAFNLDHLFSFQYTTSPTNFKHFQSCTVHYTAPLSWKHVLVVYGGYSWIKSPSSAAISSEGKTGQTSLRYQIPLNPSRGFLHEFQWGADWKWTNNEIIFNAGGGIERFANLFQLMAGYNLDYQTEITNTTFEVEAYGGPGKWLPHQCNEDYILLRNGARPKYFYARSTFSEVIKLPLSFSIWSFLRGQYAANNLLPSEQVGLGGYDTVRGYEERTFNTDNAFLFNFELRAPAFSLFNLFGGKRSVDELTFLAFFDYGVGNNHKGDVIGGRSSVNIAGVGPGVRWYWSKYLSFRSDWGIRLKKYPSEIGNGWQQLHFGITGSY